MPRSKCVFNELWLRKPEYANWLERDRDSKYSACCSVCRKTFDVSNMGEPAVRSHGRGAKHVEILKMRLQALGGGGGGGHAGRSNYFFGTAIQSASKSK